MRTPQTRRPARRLPHSLRVVILMTAASGLLGWLVGRTHIVFADGLRYIAQAQRLDRGDWSAGVRQAVDHPLYPLAVVVAHRALGGGDGPLDWQLAAQVASSVAGVLLVIPLYLMARELFGGSVAWLACVLTYLAPINGHVLADGLSEGWFLLPWTFGCWASLRFFRQGSVRWLVLAVVFSASAYLCRPEGALLPVALAVSLVMTALVPKARMTRRRWWTAAALLTACAVGLLGPYIAIKGGVGTKPAVARLLGLTPASAAGAVERERPLSVTQSSVTTCGLAVKATGEAIRDAVPLPLLVLGVVGLAARSWRSGNPRGWIFLAVVSAGWLLALVRLHATGGYCSPRHTMIVALPLSLAAAGGLRVLTAAAIGATRRVGRRSRRLSLLKMAPAVVAAGLALTSARPLLAPINMGMGGYRQAGEWLAEKASKGDRVVDVTGWSHYYGGQSGYTFANLVEAPADPSARWVVARDAHLSGPWPYCDQMRRLVEGSKLVARFPAERVIGHSRVSVFERIPRGAVSHAQTASSSDPVRR